MQEGLQELIREARRELPRASGVPLTSAEQVEEQRTAEIEKMENFVMKAFGIGAFMQLYSKVVWTERGATAHFTVDEHRFQLFKNGDSYRLHNVEADGERELLNVSGSDPNFSRRVLVAIGDALVKPE